MQFVAVDSGELNPRVSYYKILLSFTFHPYLDLFEHGVPKPKVLLSFPL